MRHSALSCRFFPALRQMEGRDCPTVTCVLNSGLLQIAGDRADNVIDISSAADGDITVNGDGQAFHFLGVQTIRTATGDGNDTVRLALREGATQFGITLSADLGGGDDTFAMTVTSSLPPTFSALPPGPCINVNVAGSTGNDSLSAAFTSASGTPATLVPTVKLAMDGGSGNDRLLLACNSLIVRGRADVTMTGGGGADAVSQDFHLNNWMAPLNLTASGGNGDDVMDTKFDSTGARSVYNAAISVSIAEDAGNDALNFALGGFSSGGGGGAGTGEKGNSTDPVVNVAFNFTLDGGDGNDTAVATAVVAPQGAGKLDARVLGGNGDDNLTLDLSAIPTLFRVVGMIDGGAGYDTHKASAGVAVLNCEA